MGVVNGRLHRAASIGANTMHLSTDHLEERVTNPRSPVPAIDRPLMLLGTNKAYSQLASRLPGGGFWQSGNVLQSGNASPF
eukprot:10581521-Ditylum_brightwellii.AAC.1